jgi:hypothetical protein
MLRAYRCGRDIRCTITQKTHQVRNRKNKWPSPARS